MITLWLALSYLIGTVVSVLLLDRVERSLDDHARGHTEEAAPAGGITRAIDHPVALDRAA